MKRRSLLLMAGAGAGGNGTPGSTQSNGLSVAIGLQGGSGAEAGEGGLYRVRHLLAHRALRHIGLELPEQPLPLRFRARGELQASAPHLKLGIAARTRIVQMSPPSVHRE